MVIDKNLIASCHGLLLSLGQTTGGIVAAIIATSDGREVASLTSQDFSVSKLSAMASTIQALGKAVAEEARFEECDNVIVESPSGKIVFMEVPSSTHELLLMVIAGKGSIFGALLLACRSCCQAIATCL